jgi:hypothetical protein
VKISHAYSMPVMSWPSNHSLLQGMAYAKDPNTGKEYLFVGKAQTGGDGDIEDSYYHRHVLQSTRWVYLDTMVGKGFGHPQNFHVRISAAGNTWLWASVEQYSGTKKTGVRPARVLWRKGTVTKSDKNFEYMPNPTGSWSVLSTFTADGPARVAMRRGQTLTETYEWHDEAALKNGIWKPLKSFKRLKTPGLYQTAAANVDSVVVFQGSTSKKHVVSRYNWAPKPLLKVDLTTLPAPTGPNTSSEPEGVAYIRDAWYVAKRYNSTERRQYELFKLYF